MRTIGADALDYMMARWRIGDHGSFMVLCALGVTELASLLFVVAIGVLNFMLKPAHGLDEISEMLGTIVMLAPLAAIFGPLLGALPGMLGGLVVTAWADFRAPTTFEFLAVAALVAGAAGLVWPIGPIDPLRGWYPMLFASIAVLSVLILAPVAQKRGIVVPAKAAP